MEERKSEYDGECRYCGSPTVGGQHAWGWTNCKNRVWPECYPDELRVRQQRHQDEIRACVDAILKERQ